MTANLTIKIINTFHKLTIHNFIDCCKLHNTLNLNLKIKNMIQKDVYYVQIIHALSSKCVI